MSKDQDKSNNKDEDYENLLNNIDGIGKNVTSIAKSLFNITSSKLDDIHVKSKEFIDELHPLDFEEVQRRTEYLRKTIDEKKAEVEQYFPRPYQSRDPVTLVNEQQQQQVQQQTETFPIFDEFDWEHRIVHPFFSGRTRKSGKTPFGYYSKSPNSTIYKDCLERNGESVWDSDGYWRCLFPNAQVPPSFLKIKENRFPDKILTKEDFFEAVKVAKSVPEDVGASVQVQSSGVFNFGSKGIFFKELSDYLNWKSTVVPTESRRIRNNRWCHNHGWGNVDTHSVSKSVPVSVAATPDSPVVEAIGELENKAPDNKMISYSVLSYYSSDDDTNKVTLNETRHEYFSDGSVKKKTITKSRPSNDTVWRDVSETNETLPKINEEQSTRSGWFWNDKES